MRLISYAFKVGCVSACMALLASCATMSPEECKVADWHAVGQQDGLQGAPLSLLGQRAEDCAKVDVGIDTASYAKGRDLGLSSYCRLENAVPLGLSGASYAGVCPPAIDGLFRMRYQLARAVFALRAELREYHDRSDRLERRLRELHREEDRQLAAASTEQARNRVRKDMDQQSNAIRHELGETDRRLHRTRDALRGAEFDLGNLR